MMAASNGPSLPSSSSTTISSKAIYTAAFSTTKKQLDDFRKQMTNKSNSPIDKQNRLIVRGPSQAPRQRIFLNKRPLHPKIDSPAAAPSKPPTTTTTTTTATPTAAATVVTTPVSNPPAPTLVLLKGQLFTAASTHIIHLVQSPPPPSSVPPKKKKLALNQEPVCLTISSDEEEEGSPSHSKDKTPPSTENPELSESLSLSCRSVRIGSFRCNVASEKEGIDVLIRETGFFFYISLDSGPGVKPILVKVLSRDLQEVLVSHNRSLPILFLHMKPEPAAAIRQALGMVRSNSKVYFDPESKQIVYKWIMLFPHSLPEGFKPKLSKILTNLLSDIDSAKANSLLVQSTNEDLKTLIVNPSTFPKIQENGEASPSSTLLVYPPPPMKGRITITTENLSCLNEGEFLNDNIIEFYLRYLYLEKLSEEMQQQVHIFSTFFYHCLTTNNHHHQAKAEPDETTEQRRYNRVKKWTRHIDLFHKKYIIVPINQQSHWFLTIICLNPETLDKGVPENTQTKPPKLGCVYLFDSLDKTRHHWRIIANLREYLTMEWRTKRPGPEYDFNSTTLPAFFPPVPLQSNFSDCGIFMLQYAEAFLKAPFGLPTGGKVSLEAWFPAEEIQGKRERLRSLILELAQRR